jgi:hypothetical protein
MKKVQARSNSIEQAYVTCAVLQYFEMSSVYSSSQLIVAVELVDIIDLGIQGRPQGCHSTIHA